jgi:TPR repeat protein
MRISRGLFAAVLLAAAGAAAAQQEPANQPKGPSTLQRGLTAYQAGQPDAAIPALTEAATTGDASARFFAEFYLARAYAEGLGAAGNHTKAYVLFRKIADENVEVDPERSPRAAFVAKALIALAGYVRDGIGEIDLAANPRRAVEYLNHAATYFGDRDAQFELARLYLGGEGSSGEVKLALHYLAVLTEASHPAAQAVLADLFWRGSHVKKDEARALALATIAVANAPSRERIWIEESYATMFCGSAPATREAAGALAARWRKMFAQPSPAPSGSVAHDLLPERQCASGEAVTIARGPRAGVAPGAPPSGIAPAKGAAAASPLFRSAGVLDASAK